VAQKAMEELYFEHYAGDEADTEGQTESRNEPTRQNRGTP